MDYYENATSTTLATLQKELKDLIYNELIDIGIKEGYTLEGKRKSAYRVKSIIFNTRERILTTEVDEANDLSLCASVLDDSPDNFEQEYFNYLDFISGLQANLNSKMVSEEICDEIVELEAKLFFSLRAYEVNPEKFR